MHESLAWTCGQIILGGFSGSSLPSSYASALGRGERSGAILFRRNLSEDLAEVAALNAQIYAATPSGAPPILGVDQEGGRVARLGPPVLRVPPMGVLASRGDPDLAERVARALGAELAALGFTTAFAPVLDVNSNPKNPVIGDRAFGADADTVSRFALPYARGLRAAGVFPCAKHFPGHGDTGTDSHFDLPLIEHDRERLDRVELAPFRAAIRDGLEAIMTAHVVVSRIDAEAPATLSHAVCTDLLRRELGFEGVLISDDLEMKAVADHFAIEDSAVRAVRAGCDLLLVCSDESLQHRAYEALVHAAERDEGLRARCREAATRVHALRLRFPPRPSATALTAALLHSRSLATELGKTP